MKLYFCNNGFMVLCTNHVPSIEVCEDRLVFKSVEPIDRFSQHNRSITLRGNMLPRIPVGKIIALEV